MSSGGGCAIGCKYCYIYAEDYKLYSKKDNQKIYDEIVPIVDRIDLLQLGCDTELFTPKRTKNTLDLIKKLSYLNKDISFATKMTLSDDAISELANIRTDLQKEKFYQPESKNELVAFISLIGYESARELEPGAPDPEERIKTMEKLSKAGIPLYVFIRHLLPQVSDLEINRIFNETKGIVSGYVVGKTYYENSKLEEELGLKVSGKKQMAWSIDRRNWNIYVDQRIETLLKKENVFSSSLEAVNSSRKKEFENAIILGLQAKENGSIDLVYDYMRINLPEKTNNITLVSQNKKNNLDWMILNSNINLNTMNSLPAEFSLNEAKNQIIIRENNMDYPANALLTESGKFFTSSIIGTKNTLQQIIDLLKSKLLEFQKTQDDFIIVNKNDKIKDADNI
jgi:DNA repair photolyase